MVTSLSGAVNLNLRLPREPIFPILASGKIAIALNALVSAAEGAPSIEASTQATVHKESIPAIDVGSGTVRPIPARTRRTQRP